MVAMLEHHPESLCQNFDFHVFLGSCWAVPQHPPHLHKSTQGIQVFITEDQLKKFHGSHSWQGQLIQLSNTKKILKFTPYQNDDHSVVDSQYQYLEFHIATNAQKC